MNIASDKVFVAFPADFNGTVTTRTTNGKIHLSDGLKANSTILPSTAGSSSSTTTYRIRPQHASGNGDSKNTNDEDDELDTCHIQTTNNSINLGYLNEVDQAQSVANGKKKEASSCLIA